MSKFMLALLVLLVLAGCGGSTPDPAGGSNPDPAGGSKPDPAHAISGTIVGQASSGVTLTLSGDGAATTVSDATGHYVFSVHDGSYAVTPTLAGGYLFSAPSRSVTVSGADVAGQDFLARGAFSIRGTVAGAVVSNVVVTLSGAASDVTTADLLGTYAFTALTNGSYTVTPSRSGYVFRPAGLQVILNGGGKDAANFDDVPEEPAIVGTTASPSVLYPSQVVAFSAQVSSPLGLPVSSLWDFGDRSVTADGPTGSHAYAAPGVYVATLRAMDLAGRTATSSSTVTVLDVPPPLLQDGALAPFCSGPLCAAVDASTYRGSGIGVWRYHNAAQDPATINVTLNGVNAKTRVTLVFANGRASNATTKPSPGLLLGQAGQAAPPSAPTQLAARFAALDLDQHGLMVERNLEIARRIIRDDAAANATATPAAPVEDLAPRPAPAFGTSRIWNETFSGFVTYPANVHFTCPLPTGRTAVFWVDPSLLAATATIEARLAELEDAFCAPGNGYADLTTLLGDVWGPAAASNRNLIQDAPGAPLDVNIVILGIPGFPVWAGYFSGANNFLAAVQPFSNEALAFFLNGSALGLNPPYNTATLLHEATHMINFYQRTIVRGTAHDAWLEETAAMMTEDVVAPGANSASGIVTPSRVRAYALTGGDVSYVNWPILSQPHYAMGGAFGAFLNRRYGLAIYQGLVTSCPDGPAGSTSYGCLDALIQQHGGAGLEDEFARLGVSAFSALPATEFPWGLAYPAILADGHVLGAIDLTRSVPPGAVPLASGFLATSHTYQSDTVGAGQTTYARSGVVVPAGTTLMVLAHPRLTCSAGAPGTCGQANLAYCGNGVGSGVCCAATFPFFCRTTSTCHPTEASALAVCGESCTACVASSP